MRTPLRAVVRLTLAACLGLAGISIAAATGRAAGPENSLPNSTLFFAKINDATALRESFDKTTYGQLLADPAMKDFEADFVEKLDEASKVLKDKVGVTLKELLTLPTGTISLAIVSKAEGKTPVAVLIQADAGKNAGRMDEVLNKATKIAQEDAKDAAKVSTQTFKDLTLHVIQNSKDESTPPMVWTKSGNVFHIASDVDALKDLLSHADGREDSLAKSESYARVAKKLGDGDQASWYLDIGSVIKLVVKAAANNPNAGNPEAILQILGFNGLKAAGGNIAFNHGPHDSLSKIFILAPSPVQGVLKIFSMPKANLRPEPWVPGTISSYSTISWDLDAAYTAINDLANNFQPGALNMIEQQLAGPGGGEPFSFQKDFFGPLGDRITFLSDFKKPIKEDSQRLLLAISLEDAKKFQATLNKLIAITNASPAKREFQGTTIYDFKIPEMPNQAANNPFKGTISLAIAKDSLFVSNEPGLLEMVLRGGGSALADDAEFQKVAKDMPSQVSSLTFAKGEEQARASYDMIKNGSFEKAMMASNGNNKEVAEAMSKLFNKDKLPEFSVFAKYLTQGGSYGVQDEDGYLQTSYTLKPSKP